MYGARSSDMRVESVLLSLFSPEHINLPSQLVSTCKCLRHYYCYSALSVSLSLAECQLHKKVNQSSEGEEDEEEEGKQKKRDEEISLCVSTQITMCQVNVSTY